MRQLLVLTLVACSRKDEPAAHQRTTPISCEEFLAKVNAITKTPSKAPYKPDDPFCVKHTDEQRRCTMSATTTPEFNLCSQFADVQRREAARKTQTSIKGAFPGRVELSDVLAQRGGCAFVGIVGHEAYPFDDTRAFVTFATHGLVGKDQFLNVNALVTLTVGMRGTTWACTETDPPNLCAMITEWCR